MNGYGADEVVPDYRVVHGTLRAWNPYSGQWMPIRFSKPEHYERFSKRGMGSSIAELEQLMAGVKHNDQLQMSLPPQLHSALVGDDPAFEPAFVFGTTTVRGILSRVRQTILDWALELEKRGVSGEGLSFTSEEKTTAQGVHFNISASRNVTIVGGDSVNSVIASGDGSLDLNAVRAMLAQLHAASFDDADGKLIESTKQEIEKELEKPAPNVSRVRAYLSSIKAIAEGAVGNVAAHGLVQLIAKLLG